MITLDFETYYDKEYSLSKLTTEQYIRDPRFQVVGFGYKVDDGDAHWVSGSDDDIRAALVSLDIPNHNLLCHNAAFDGAILNWKFGIMPKYYFDTLSMSRPVTGLSVGGSLDALAKKFMLGEKGKEVVAAMGLRREDFSTEQLAAYGNYCKNDVQLTHTLFQVMKQFSTQKEMFIIDLMLRMFIDPVLELDHDVLHDHLIDVIERRQQLLVRINDSGGLGTIMSNAKFAELLKSYGVDPPTKISPRTGKETWAFSKTDQGLKALLDHENDAVQAVVTARLGLKSTIEQTRTEAFLGIASRGTLPILLNYYGGHTGRASGGDKINLQNLPRGGKLRKAIRAPDGHVLVAVDSSQIEARGVAWLAGQTDLVEDFRNGVDIYSDFASDVYGYPVNKYEHLVERFLGKTCLAEGTMVLCVSGWKPIEQVERTDLIWDGEEWVRHGGTVFNGWKQTLQLCGTWMTPDHLVWSGTRWLEAQFLEHDESTRFRSLATAAASLPLPGTSEGLGEEPPPSLFDVIAGDQSTRWPITTSACSTRLAARFARRKLPLVSDIGSTPKPSPTMPTELGYSTGWLRRSVDVMSRRTASTATTVVGALRSMLGGETTAPASYATSRPYQGGMTLPRTWTASTTTGATSRGTSGSLQEPRTLLTNGRWESFKNVSPALRKSLRVYDIVNAGPRNRFMVQTDAGPLIVHNCILGLGFEMGKDKFQASLKAGKTPINLSASEAERIVQLYRNKYGEIKKLWRSAHAAMHSVLRGYDAEFGVGMSLPWDDAGIHLPNGMLLRYPNLRAASDGAVYDNRKLTTSLYSGKIVENTVQALARIVVFEQMCRIEQHLRRRSKEMVDDLTRRVVFMVHDEVVVCVPEEESEATLRLMVREMSVPPKWAPDLPVACEGNVGKNYGDTK